MRVINCEKENLEELQCVQNIVLSSLEEIQRRNKMLEYYKGKNTEIQRKQCKENSFVTANNKLAVPFASMISDTITGYFKGLPTTYNTDNEALLDLLQENDVDEKDYLLALDCSIFGIAFEMLYIDDEPKFERLDPRTCIACYSNSAGNELIGVIRIHKETDWNNGNQISYTDVYTKDAVYSYSGDGNYMNLNFIKKENNIWNEVPFVVYLNNSAVYGDFERVISLIDAYDLMLSNNIDSFEAQLHDNYLVLCGVSFNDENEADDFFNSVFEDGIIMLKKGAEESGRESAEFISTKTDTATVSFTLDKLEDLIYSMSQCVRLNDEKVGTASSGVAIQFKFTPVENLCNAKEGLFKKGLYRRCEMLLRYINATTNDKKDLDIIMTRELPVNQAENAQVLQIYKNLGVSEETILANIPIVDDINQEQWRKKGDIVDGRRQQQQPTEQ